MKSILKLSLITMAFVFVSSVSFGQVVISGSQTAGTAGNNAKLKCEAVKISQTMKIVDITGNNAGFWITKGSVIIKRYYKQNDPAAKGLSLKPGTYYVYPNLPEGKTYATVKLKLK